ncbi:hypothetical protein BDV96DRAFT_580683 [Lophiotrema nucula]|uniref:Mid2 domain-containing protein n=1 Tax=Lophiotrema nucula TaxID=690887 RepID=A0A6A5Z0P8_9PLEO|nr:hypothetical protein BDV96DRAFT_580683 [Lophiotrema nucula]
MFLHRDLVLTNHPPSGIRNISPNFQFSYSPGSLFILKMRLASHDRDGIVRGSEAGIEVAFSSSARARGTFHDTVSQVFRISHSFLCLIFCHSFDRSRSFDIFVKMVRVQLLSLSCALLNGLLSWGVQGSCYYPDGSFPDDYIYTECSSDEGTTCCRLEEGDQCLSNGLCYYPWGEYMFRGGCSDKSWNSTGCFQHCKTGDSSNTYDQLVSCGDNRYCCYSDGSTCCNDDSKVFTVDSASVIKDLATTASLSLPIATPSDASIPSATDDTGTLPTSSVDISSSKPKATGSRAASNTAATPTPTTTSAENTSSSSSSKGASKTALIGIVIGGIIILLLAIGLVWFFVRHRYRKKLAVNGSNNQSFPLSSDGFQKLPDKSPRPVEVPAPISSPAPPYQPPAYGVHGGAVEIDNSYRVPGVNQWGQPVYEAPAQAYGRM